MPVHFRSTDPLVSGPREFHRFVIEVEVEVIDEHSAAAARLPLQADADGVASHIMDRHPIQWNLELALASTMWNSPSMNGLRLRSWNVAHRPVFDGQHNEHVIPARPERQGN